MNSPVYITREHAALDEAVAARRASLTGRNTSNTDGHTWVARYEGCAIIRLAGGLYYTDETGAAETIEQVREDIDRMLDARDAPGFGQWEPRT